MLFNSFSEYFHPGLSISIIYLSFSAAIQSIFKQYAEEILHILPFRVYYVGSIFWQKARQFMAKNYLKKKKKQTKMQCVPDKESGNLGSSFGSG